MADVPESPSALLERAAALLEHIADEAPPPPWREHGLVGAIHAPNPTSAKGVEVVAVRTTWGATRWIEVMSPAVAAPLVNWLRDTAEDLRLAPAQTSQEDYALEFARLVLGEHTKEDGRA